jgi:hypothetical protein
VTIADFLAGVVFAGVLFSGLFKGRFAGDFFLLSTSWSGLLKVMILRAELRNLENIEILR